jgi:hypothetical protein
MAGAAVENARVFVAAALGSGVTTAFCRGVRGESAALDCQTAVIDALKAGSAFAAYPMGQAFLQSHFPSYQQRLKDNLSTAAASAIAGSVALTALNYPIFRLQEFRETGEITLQARATLDFFIDNILPFVGFPVTTNYLEAKLPTSTNSLVAWGRYQFIYALGGLGAAVAQTPLNIIKGRGVVGAFREWLAGIGPGIVISESAFHFTQLLS